MGTRNVLGRRVSDLFDQSKGCLFFFDDHFRVARKNNRALEEKIITARQASVVFRSEPIDSGWLPNGVLRWGQDARGVWVVRWQDAALYTLLLDDRTGKKPQQIRVPMPPLIWIGRANDYYIFAARAQKFRPDVMLYHAPLPNIYESGRVCFGQNRREDVSKGGFDKTWQLFWKAPFNDHQDNDRSLRSVDSIANHLRHLHRQKAEIYPLNDLISTKTTLEEKLGAKGAFDDF